LSGPDHATSEAKSDFDRFRLEMETLGIVAEWRVAKKSDIDWHDRFVVTRRNSWNVPPINTIFRGSYSEAFNTTERPPFEEWWQRGVPISSYLEQRG
jgi:hypothetical protein